MLRKSPTSSRIVIQFPTAEDERSDNVVTSETVWRWFLVVLVPLSCWSFCWIQRRIRAGLCKFTTWDIPKGLLHVPPRNCSSCKLQMYGLLSYYIFAAYLAVAFAGADFFILPLKRLASLYAPTTFLVPPVVLLIFALGSGKKCNHSSLGRCCLLGFTYLSVATGVALTVTIASIHAHLPEVDKCMTTCMNGEYCESPRLVGNVRPMQPRDRAHTLGFLRKKILASDGLDFSARAQWPSEMPAPGSVTNIKVELFVNNIWMLDLDVVLKMSVENSSKVIIVGDHEWVWRLRDYGEPWTDITTVASALVIPTLENDRYASPANSLLRNRLLRAFGNAVVGTFGLNVEASAAVLLSGHDFLSRWKRRLVGGCSRGGKHALYLAVISSEVNQLLLISSGTMGAAVASLMNSCGEHSAAIFSTNRWFSWFRGVGSPESPGNTANHNNSAHDFPVLGAPYDMDDLLLDVVCRNISIHIYSSAYDLWNNPLGQLAAYRSVLTYLRKGTKFERELRHKITLAQPESVGHCPNINFPAYSILYSMPSVPENAVLNFRNFVYWGNVTSSTIEGGFTNGELSLVQQWLVARHRYGGDDN